MRLVGHHSRKGGGVLVEASATGKSIRRFLSKRLQLHSLIQDAQTSRTYYDSHLESCGSAKTLHGMKPAMAPERKRTLALVDPVINSGFLKKGSTGTYAGPDVPRHTQKFQTGLQKSRLRGEYPARAMEVKRNKTVSGRSFGKSDRQLTLTFTFTCGN